MLFRSEHFPIILFSHLPLKFFFLILRKISHPGTSCIFPKTAPKNEIIPLLGIWEIPFCGNEKPEIQHLQGFHTRSHFPKNIRNKYHHVVGHCNLFCIRHLKGTFVYPLYLVKVCPYSMVILLQFVPKNPVFMRGKDSPEDKNKTLHPYLQGLIFLCRRINVFALL